MKPIYSPFEKIATNESVAEKSVYEQSKNRADEIANNIKAKVKPAYDKVKRVADVVWTGTKLKPLFGAISRVPGIGKFVAGAGITGVGMLGGSALMSKDVDPVMSALGLDDASDDHKNLALLAMTSAPILGAVAGSTSGTGALSGALTGVGALGGSYIGFKGSRKLLDTVEELGGLDWMNDDWKSIAKILATTGSTALGGITGAHLGSMATPIKNKPTE